jgi:hypothetical protein
VRFILVRKNLIHLLALTLLAACAPKVQDRSFAVPPQSFGPRFEDTDLSPKIKTSGQRNKVLSWQGLVPTATYFQQAENLMVLGAISGRSALTLKGQTWIERFYQQPGTANHLEFGRTPFAVMAATTTEEDVSESLNEVHSDITKSRGVLKSKIMELGNAYPWPQGNASLNEILNAATSFVEQYSNQVGKLALPAAIVDGVQTELKIQTEPIFNDMRSLIERLSASHDFPGSLALIQDELKKLDVKLPAESQKEWDQGLLIAKDLGQLKTAQAGLTILIDIWKALTPAERISLVKTENKSLYDFLSNQDADSLNCLRRKDCNGGLFIGGIKKRLFILPQIESYGVENLRKNLNEKINSRFSEEVSNFAQTFIRSLTATISEKMDQGLVAKDAELQNVQKDYAGYLRDLLNKWSQKSLPASRGQVTGFETPVISINLSSQSKMALAASGSALDLTANTAGASLSANALWFEFNGGKNSELRLQAAVSQVNKLLSIGGYRDEKKSLVPAILSPVDKINSFLDLMDFSNLNTAYRIPDKLKLSDAFHVSGEVPVNKEFSAQSFAIQLRGLSQMLNFTADWRKSNFEDTLGKIRAQDLTADYKSPALNRPLFPKDTIFALNLADAGVLLKGITGPSSPVFLISLDKQIIWADQYDRKSKSQGTPIMAGLVDIKAGVRSNIVHSQDVAQFLLAIREFLKATEGAEKAKSDLLTKAGRDGQTPLQSLADGRQDLKLLSIAMANFISNQMLNDKAQVQSTYYLAQMQKSNDPAYWVLDQALAMRALIAAWEISHIDTYMNSAQEIYFSLNKYAFSSEEGFYKNGDGSTLTFPDRVETLRALSEIKNYLPPESRRQLETISAPWLKALEDLQ